MTVKYFGGSAPPGAMLLDLARAAAPYSLNSVRLKSKLTNPAYGMLTLMSAGVAAP